MTINFSTVIADFDDKPLVDEAGKPLTLATVAINALSTKHPQETINRISLALYGLARKIKAEVVRCMPSGEGATGETVMVEVNKDQIRLIQDRVAIFYSPLVLGRVCEIMGDGAILPFKKEK